jgi:hypothetical protein
MRRATLHTPSCSIIDLGVEGCSMLAGEDHTSSHAPGRLSDGMERSADSLFEGGGGWGGWTSLKE